MGFALGAGATYVFLHQGGSTAPCDRSANQDAMNGRECLGLTLLGGLVGAGLGALAGHFVRTDEWRQVPIENVRVGLTPDRRGALAVSLSLRPGS